MFGLGELEGAVMTVLWAADEPTTVREVLHRLGTRKKRSYTTIMTVLGNLHRKGWVHRELRDRAYRYRPAVSLEEAATRALREALAVSGNPEAALFHFANSASDHEVELLLRVLDRRDHRDDVGQ